ncbi:MAG: NAD(P)H-dependent oxidoreductase subunit E [Planctomycetota bacterium]|jgi:NADH:ubiquinone oxidoreductase subunit E|nr:NAD(P)H-dependent oxidoreductase subunit E [Planctomycetota bacterium]
MSGCNAQAIIDAQLDLTIEQVRERMQPYTARVAELQRRYAMKRGVLLQALWLIQEEFGWVPRIGIKWAAEVSDVSPVHAYGVAEFYTMYRKAPMGRFLIQVCEGMCCQLKGANDLIAHLEQALGIHAGDTTEDGLFTVLRVQCLAACGNGPSVLINDEFLYGPGELNEHQEGWSPSAADLDRWIERLRKEAEAKPQPDKVDSLGDIMLDTKGHPGSDGASGAPLPKDYAPPPPALKVKAESQGSAITVSCLCAPEITEASVERSTDGGTTWAAIGTIDVVKTPGVPGPPGGPKTPSYTDEIAVGSTAAYRIVAREAEREARPSAVAEVTAAAVSDDGEEGGKA